MKSSLLKIIAAASLVMASFGFAQDEEPAQKSAAKSRDNGVGIHVAFDYGMMYGFEEEDDNVDGDPAGMGFSAGIAGRLEMVSNLYFVPEVDFSYMTTDHKLNDMKRTYSSMGLEIPLMFRGVVMDRFYVTAGPQLNLCLSADYEAEYEEKNLGDGLTFDIEFQDNVEQGSFTFGIAAGAGAQLYEGIYFDFRFYMGLSELFPDTKSIGNGVDNVKDAGDNWSMINMAGAKMMSFKFGLTYWFM